MHVLLYTSLSTNYSNMLTIDTVAAVLIGIDTVANILRSV